MGEHWRARVFRALPWRLRFWVLTGGNRVTAWLTCWFLAEEWARCEPGYWAWREGRDA